MNSFERAFPALLAHIRQVGASSRAWVDLGDSDLNVGTFLCVWDRLTVAHWVLGRTASTRVH